MAVRNRWPRPLPLLPAADERLDRQRGEEDGKHDEHDGIHRAERDAAVLDVRAVVVPDVAEEDKAVGEGDDPEHPQVERALLVEREVRVLEDADHDEYGDRRADEQERFDNGVAPAVAVARALDERVDRKQDNKRPERRAVGLETREGLPLVVLFLPPALPAYEIEHDRDPGDQRHARDEVENVCGAYQHRKITSFLFWQYNIILMT